jgi:hypothetical protein
MTADGFVIFGVAKPSRSEFEYRFWSKAKKAGGCWVWQARGRVGKGYGKFSVRRGWNQLAHRVAWSLVNGEIPDGLHVLHSCDNMLCVNPVHLFLGTNKDNIDDKVGKGRQSKGGDYSSAVFTEADVREMRRMRFDLGMSYGKIAKAFGKAYSAQIWQIVNKRVWKHV